MRLKDLDTTTVYAYRTSKYHQPRQILVLDASQLYTSSRRRASDSTPVPARPGVRATVGTGYYGSTIGVLFREADKPTGAPQLAMPQHILSTWANWLVLDAEEKTIARRQQLAKENRETDNRRNAERVKQLLQAHPEIPGFHVSLYQSYTSVPYTTLIQILEALPHADV